MRLFFGIAIGHVLGEISDSLDDKKICFLFETKEKMLVFVSEKYFRKTYQNFTRLSYDRISWTWNLSTKLETVINEIAEKRYVTYEANEKWMVSSRDLSRSLEDYINFSHRPQTNRLGMQTLS